MWQIGADELESRLLLGTALYPSPKELVASIEASGTQIVTVSLRRQSATSTGGNWFWDLIKQQKVRVLPNTANCKSAAQAVTTAHMAREVFNTNWIKLEVIGDDLTLQPDPFELIVAARQLISDGFEVFPYCTDDLILAQRLVDAGCRIVMPWAAPIGTGLGPINLRALELLRNRLPDTTLIVDAGIGKPSHAAAVMEIGFDAVLLNSAVALARHPASMSGAFAQAIAGGRLAYKSGIMPERKFASASTPSLGTPFALSTEAAL